MEANREYLRSRHRATQAQQLVAVAITSDTPLTSLNAMCAAEPFGGMQQQRFSIVQNSRFQSDKER
ncbi:hypothetical protein NLY39_07685 [Pseudomonas sp. KHPS1]|nr:hypothetical protein [Pseudomonas sp. KHPS1]UTH38022.1 hypothetical protein NLY39_07685 [Pseudomonas sp. KHPS1]